ncbi:MAG: alpha/beta hydrolase-fold protein, partial [Gemmatimonadota bacterium]
YERSDEVYPVLVVLDGPSLFPPAAGIAEFLAGVLEVPPMIVVGVPSGARTRDLTPPPSDGWSPPLAPEDGPVGGAPRFLSFLVDELLPRVEARYRAAPFRILAGHSLGGLFVTWAVAERPDVFGGGLAMDPALWWNDRASVDRLASTLAHDPAASRVRFVSVEAAGGFRGDWERIGSARPDLVGGRIEVEGESHETMPVRGLREGLRALFPDYPPRAPAPGQSAVAALDAGYRELSDLLGYPVAAPDGALGRAGRMAVEGDFLDDARAVADRLRLRSRADMATDLEERIRRAADASGARFVPLVMQTPRPSAGRLRPFVGCWRGVLDYERGVDSDLTLEIMPEGDSIRIHAVQAYPRGQFEGDRVLVGITSDGALEFGQPMRGGVGMEVATVRLVDGGRRLEGRVEIRGFRIPPGATPDRVTLELRRVGSS